MTELEAFRHYSESSGPFIDYSSVKRAWKAACEWQRSVCNEELVMLRQQNKDLQEAMFEDQETIETMRQRVDLWKTTAKNQQISLAELRQRIAEFEAEVNASPCAGFTSRENETMRQRVNELDGYKAAWVETAKHRDAAERELAALKQQGEMVGYFVNVNLPGIRPNYQQVTDDCAGDSDVVRLYTAPPVQQGEPVAWLTYTDNGLPMLWTDLPEATLYCDDDETPTPLYTAPPTCFSAADMANAQAKAFRDGVESVITENTLAHCATCSNRGRVDGGSQETYCEKCVFQRTWRQDHYAPIVKHGEKPCESA